MEKTNFDRLLQRYLTGQVSEDERIKLEAWLDITKGEDTTDLELSKEDEDRLFQKITNNAVDVKEVVAFRSEHAEVRSLLTKPWFQVAATLVLLFVASYTIWYSINARSKVQEILAKDGIEKFILDDGTIVWVQKDSKLSYHDKVEEGIRYAELSGEALFEVAKDASRPFTLVCGDVTVKVLGTSFSIRTVDESIELKVLTGKVHLSSLKDEAGINVEPNEKVVYSARGTIERIPIEAAAMEEIVAYDEYNMQFNNTPLDKVFERVERKFDVTVSVENNQVTRCRVTADFTDQSLDTTMKMLTEVLELDYKIKENTVAISGKGCN